MKQAVISMSAVVGALAVAVLTSPHVSGADRTNIILIMADDIGFMQPSIYHRGIMVGETPNIDRMGKEGGMFMDYYAMQSCTSGRAAFITGQVLAVDGGLVMM